MFGTVTGNLAIMTEAEKARYHAAYCGLCREIGRLSGETARMTITYDLVFLVLLESSLYEPDEQSGQKRCITHPLRRQSYFTNACTAYGADMNVYLAYYKALDDWNDEHQQTRRIQAAALKGPAERIEIRHPRQCACIRRELAVIGETERDSARPPDEAANAFGRLMGELFVYDERDYFADTLRAFGCGLGRFVYMMDAALDYEKDKRACAFNPLIRMDVAPADFREALTLLIGEAAAAFERLPLEQDLSLLRNILYGGVWQRYNAAFEAKPGGKDGNSDD